MVTYGYKLMSEEHGPAALVRNAVLAEESGLAFVAISDHYHPWLEEQGHSPFAWTVLGAIAQATSTVGLATAVTCPLVRYHPAVVAQMAATLAVLSEGRFTLGLGTGELLNEHVVSAGWPAVDVRQEMLEEAVAIIRRLWEGDQVTLRGHWLEVERARLYDLPESPPELIVAVSGPGSLAVATELADGIIAVDPDASLVDGFRAERQGPCYAEVPLCWAASEEEAVRTAHERFRFGLPGWPVMAELPTPEAFAAATATVRAEDVREQIACGPDPLRHLEVIGRFRDAGFDHLVLVGVGPDQEGFLRFWREELQPRLS